MAADLTTPTKATGEWFDPKQRRGVQAPELARGRNGLALVAFEEALWALGGMFNEPGTEFGNPTKLNERMVPRMGRWEAAPGLLQGRGYHGAIASRGHIIVAGGFVRPRPTAAGSPRAPTASRSTIQRARRWYASSPLPFPGAMVRIEEVRGALYAFTGRGSKVFKGTFVEADDAPPPPKPFPVARVIAVLLAAAAVVSFFVTRKKSGSEGAA